MVGATSVGLPGAFLPDEGVQRMFGGGIPRGAVIGAPMGRAEAAPGGWRLSGRWPFVSGVRHAEWIAVGAMAPPAEGAAPAHRMMVVPADQALIHDNWQVAGLKGTGSCDVSVENVFVPRSCAWNFRSADPKRDGPIYRIGFTGFVVNEHAGFALGTARRALDAFVGGMTAKQRGDASGLAGRPMVQHMLGRSELALSAARSRAIELNDAAYRLAVAGDPVPERLQAELRAVAVYCTEVAVDVVTQAFRFAGGGAAYSTNVLQQCLRDINVAAQHLQTSEIAYENLGQFILGLPTASATR